MSSGAVISEPPAVAPAAPAAAGAQRRLASAGHLLWPTLAIAAILCWITFHAGGGLNLESMTGLEVWLTIGSAIVIAAAVLLVPAGRPAYGVWSVALLLAFAALSALSVVWSVQPDHSWQDAARLFAYGAVFAAAVALVRVAPSRWPALLGGGVLAAVVVCGYALLTKVYPAHFDVNDVYARLQEPYGYWNATGLIAAMGVVACLWLGARRSGHALLSALAYPATGLLLVTLMLAYSRGALAALLCGLALWFVLVPLRLRGAALLAVSGAGAGAVIAWAFSRHALSSDNVALAQRVSAGHQLGVLLLAMLVVLALAGLAIGFLTGRRAPREVSRRRAGGLLIALLVAGVLAGLGGLAASHRGLLGSISHAAHALTSTHAKVPSNGPNRLTAIASVRAIYWNQAFAIFEAHPLLGVGARGYETAQLRYRTETLEAKNAHGYLVQTLADLGLVGLAVTLALLAAWLIAAARSTRPLNLRRQRTALRREPLPYTAERVGLLSMLCLVVVFGLHSFIDWTWYVPGNACLALLCAGWLAGRGWPAAAGHAEATTFVIGAAAGGRRWPVRADLRSPRAILAVCVLIAAALVVWAQRQPQSSVNASDEALELLARNPRAAQAAAQSAVSRDPLSVNALFTLAKVQQYEGQAAKARATLQQAVTLQPSNPQTWLALGRYDLNDNPAASLHELRAAIYLNPESIAPSLIEEGNPEAISIRNSFVQAYQRAGSAAAEPALAPARTRPTAPASARLPRRR